MQDGGYKAARDGSSIYVDNMKSLFSKWRNLAPVMVRPGTGPDTRRERTNLQRYESHFLLNVQAARWSANIGIKRAHIESLVVCSPCFWSHGLYHSYNNASRFISSSMYVGYVKVNIA